MRGSRHVLDGSSFELFAKEVSERVCCLRATAGRNFGFDVEGGLMSQPRGIVVSAWVLPMIAAVFVSGVLSPATAAKPDVAAAGSGSFGGACLTVAGASSHTADRWRWSVSYWAAASAPGPVGTCPEGEAHAEPSITCAEVVTRDDGTRELFLSGRGSDRNTFYVRISDGGPSRPDSAGVAVDASTDLARCGAAEVPLAPLSDGGFTVLGV